LLNNVLAPLVVIGIDNAISRVVVQKIRERGAPVIELGKSGGTSNLPPTTIELDVAQDENWLRLLNDPRLNGRLNFLYTVGFGGASVMSLTTGSTVRKHTDINIVGLHNFFSFLSRRENEWSDSASVVVISSLNSSIPVAGYSAYCATKAAAVMLAKVAAIELAPKYRVNLVAPGPFLSDDLSSVAIHGRHNQQLLNRHLLDKRLTSVCDIWGVVDFLLSPESSWMTGCELPVDGGLHLL
jgi:NAD(P)-dependent dehydrogenase (short-subunit alcohol dehydrogenase family)